MLWNCRAANEVWLASYLMIQKSPSMMADTTELWGFFMECMKPPDIVLTANLMRHMWSRRNDFVFNSKVGPPYCTVQTAWEELELLSSIAEADQLSENGTRSVAKWRPPEQASMKLNWDAALDIKNRKLGIGIIIRHHNGAVVACLSSVEDFHSKAVLAECRALWRALVFSEQLSIDKVTLEGDAQVVIQAAKKEETCSAW